MKEASRGSSYQLGQLFEMAGMRDVLFHVELKRAVYPLEVLLPPLITKAPLRVIMNNHHFLASSSDVLPPPTDRFSSESVHPDTELLKDTSAHGEKRDDITADVTIRNSSSSIFFWLPDARLLLSNFHGNAIKASLVVCSKSHQSVLSSDSTLQHPQSPNDTLIKMVGFEMKRHISPIDTFLMDSNDWREKNPNSPAFPLLFHSSSVGFKGTENSLQEKRLMFVVAVSVSSPLLKKDAAHGSSLSKDSGVMGKMGTRREVFPGLDMAWMGTRLD
ncbi:hypothetical protein DNTS_034660 [Danionella cerebrum]|uniref:Uncharacterized protein n=1 Tax=Danionella cerebrum TaxID=2873325 RepID=A0A553N3J0_9TELE|nr:hypothetical protein DNTS_034660 [Danionella translucida]